MGQVTGLGRAEAKQGNAGRVWAKNGRRRSETSSLGFKVMTLLRDQFWSGEERVPVPCTTWVLRRGLKPPPTHSRWAA